MNILLIDNEPKWINAVRAACDAAGVDVTVATERLPGDFDRVIVSARLFDRVLDRVDVTGAIVMTGSPSERQRLLAYRAGATDYKIKDFHPERVKKLVTI